MVGNCTKGEWEVEQRGENCFVILGSERQVIAAADLVYRDKGLSEKENLANVNLMAASKNLYSELIGANETICTLCKKVNPQFKDCTSCLDREARLKAIHKATGKEVK